jgi:hypothetical protein
MWYGSRRYAKTPFLRGKGDGGAMSKTDIQPAFTLDSIAKRIFEIRGQRVMLDADLAGMYGAETGALIQAVKRNPERFPADLMFQLSTPEWESLKSQIVTSNKGRGGRRSAPYAFTEHGALMLSSVLKSARAVEVSLLIIRAFVWLRKAVPAYKELADKVAELEKTVGRHDKDIEMVFEALKQLIVPPEKDRQKIGF